MRRRLAKKIVDHPERYSTGQHEAALRCLGKIWRVVVRCEYRPVAWDYDNGKWVVPLHPTYTGSPFVVLSEK